MAGTMNINGLFDELPLYRRIFLKIFAHKTVEITDEGLFEPFDTKTIRYSWRGADYIIEEFVPKPPPEHVNCRCTVKEFNPDVRYIIEEDKS